MFPISEGKYPMTPGFYEMCRTLSLLLSLVNSWENLSSKMLELRQSYLNKLGSEDMPTTWVRLFSLEVVLSYSNISKPAHFLVFPGKFASGICGRDQSGL